MNRPVVVVLRPQPGAAATVARAEAMGLTAIAAPLSQIEPIAWRAPDPARFDALLLGSANAIRHGGRGLQRFHGLPVYAVGETTALAAREAGFSVACVGEGSLQALLGAVVADGRTRSLRIAGEERVALDAPAELSIETVVAYRTRPRPLEPAALAALREGAVALLHSAAIARALADACSQGAIDRQGVTLACLSPRIAEAAGTGWAAIRIAATPDDAALLALAREMCQNACFGGTDHND